MIDRAAIGARGCACYADSTESCPIPALLAELARVEGKAGKCVSGWSIVGGDCPCHHLLQQRNDELARVEGELAKCGRENCMGWKLEDAENWVSEGRLLEVQAKLTAATKAIENLQATLAHVEGERDEARADLSDVRLKYIQGLRDVLHAEARLTAATEAGDQYKRLHGDLAQQYRERLWERDAATEAAERLRGTLEKHGRHLSGCNRWMCHEHRKGGNCCHCSCGLDAALAAHAEPPAREPGQTTHTED